MKSSNAHFTDYRILEADDAQALSKAVMHAIHNGWQPYGDMSVAHLRGDPENGLRLFQPIVTQAEWSG